jgi:predicted O-methyltransferase YrrM
VARAVTGPLLRRLSRTRLGRRALAKVVLSVPDLALHALGWRLAAEAALPAEERLPATLGGFEDAAPLVLSSNPANRGVASMRLDEAAHLWSLARSAGDATLVELGRERGGSTLLLAAAMASGATLHSYDPQTKLGSLHPDEALARLLRRYGLDGRVELHVADSHAVEPPPGELALVLVDGDPTYAGTRQDYETFCLRLRPGGHALFHDAAPGGPRHETLAPLVDEIEREGAFERRPDVGSFVHFSRRPS